MNKISKVVLGTVAAVAVSASAAFATIPAQTNCPYVLQYEHEARYAFS
jgi:hypothetical protein